MGDAIAQQSAIGDEEDDGIQGGFTSEPFAESISTLHSWYSWSGMEVVELHRNAALALSVVRRAPKCVC